MAFGQLSPDLLQTITIAVKTSGQQAILDLQAQLARTEQEIDNWKAALQQGIVPATQFTQEVERLVAAQRQLQASIGAASNVMRGIPAGFALSGQAALSLSYALDDLQYGFSAIVNNAPHLALALGGGPGLAGVLGAVFVAANQVSTHWPQIKAMFDDGLSKKLIDDLDSVQKGLKELTAREWKTRIDVQDIQIAKDKLDELNRAKRGFEGLNAQTELEKRAGETLTEGIVEGGGRKAVTRAVLAATAPQQTPEQEKILAEIRDLEARVERAQQFGGDVELEGRLRGLRSSAEGKDAIDVQNRRAAVEQQIGLAAQGDQIQRRWLEEVFKANPDKFRAAGVDLDRFGAGLANAAPDRAFEPERRKIAKENARKEAQALAERNRLHEEAQRKQEQYEKHLADTDPDITGKFRDRRLQSQIDVTDEDARKRAQDSAREAREAKADAAARARDLDNTALTPAREKRQAEASYGQEFQSRARKIGIPISGQQAAVAGRDVAGMVGNGVDVDSAMQQALANLGGLVRRQNMQALRNAAAWEQMNNMVGEATMQLMLVEQQQRRNQVQRPHGNVR